MRDGDPEDAILGALAQTHGLDPVAVRGDLRSFAHAVRSAGLLEPDEVSEQRAVLRPPQERPALDAAYRLGEIAVRVTCYPADIAAAFAPLAAPALAPDGAVPQTRLALFRAGETFVLTRDDRVVDHLDTAPAARWAMVRQLVLAGTRRSWLALLHAGAVATPRAACCSAATVAPARARCSPASSMRVSRSSPTTSCRSRSDPGWSGRCGSRSASRTAAGP